MNFLAIVSIVLGVLLILMRGSFAIAPRKFADFYIDQFFANNLKVRLNSVFVMVLGAIMIIASKDYIQTEAVIIYYFGWLLAVIAGPLMMIFTSPIRQAATLFTKNIPEMFSRVGGIFFIIVGGYFIYFGVSLMM